MPKSPGVRVLEAGKLASAPPAGAVPANPREGPPILDADAGAVVFLATPAPWPEDNLGCRCFFPGMAPAEAVEEVDPRATACLPAGTSAESPSMAAVSASEINSGTPMDERRETLPVGAACAGTGSRRGEEGEEERRLFASTPAPSTSPSSRLARLCLLSGLRDASCIFNEEISESRVASMVSRSCTLRLALELLERSSSISALWHFTILVWSARSSASMRIRSVACADSSPPPLLADARSTAATLMPKLRVERVSCADSTSGLTCRSITILAEPAMESCSTCVSLELRYGTWLLLFCSAHTTSPSAESDLLMHCASLRRSPAASECFTRSLPARSTNCNLVHVTTPVALSVASTRMVRISWEREECALRAVLSVARRASPTPRACITSAVQVTGTRVVLATPSTSFTSCGLALGSLEEPSRSLSWSLYTSSNSRLNP
mmetsp:Transcript_3440/g.6433  ORF Transcript_3440/g.6433 Transcript_3440/m.6433 type:complete len:438 (-) Transcript_3440:317-1630(-)